MTLPERDTPSPTAQRYHVFAVTSRGEERLLKIFEHADDAQAFARFLSNGGNFLGIRVATVPAASEPVRAPSPEPTQDTPAQTHSATIPTENVSDEPLVCPPRPGGFYRFLYVSSALGGTV